MILKVPQLSKSEIKYLNLWKTDKEEKYLISSLKQNLIKFCKGSKRYN